MKVQKGTFSPTIVVCQRPLDENNVYAKVAHSEIHHILCLSATEKGRGRIIVWTECLRFCAQNRHLDNPTRGP